MGEGDKYGPPPGLTEEERREWYRRNQWRKFTWLEDDILITRRGDGEKPKEGDGDKSPGR